MIGVLGSIGAGVMQSTLTTTLARALAVTGSWRTSASSSALRFSGSVAAYWPSCGSSYVAASQKVLACLASMALCPKRVDAALGEDHRFGMHRPRHELVAFDGAQCQLALCGGAEDAGRELF